MSRAKAKGTPDMDVVAAVARTLNVSGGPDGGVGVEMHKAAWYVSREISRLEAQQ